MARTVHAQAPPRVEVHLTEWGQSRCPALDELLAWADKRPAPARPRRAPPTP